MHVRESVFLLLLLHASLEVLPLSFLSAVAMVGTALLRPQRQKRMSHSTLMLWARRATSEQTPLRRRFCSQSVAVMSSRSRSGALKTLTSLNKEVGPFFLSDSSIWCFPSVSSLSDYSIWRSWGLFYPCDHSISSISVHCPQILLSLRKNGIWGV